MKIMKITRSFITIALGLLAVEAAQAQSNCEEIKKENEYLRKAMKITAPIKSITSSNIDFNIIKCVGNKKDQTVELTLMLVNHDANQNFQFERALAIDVNGNEYKTFDIKIGSGGSMNNIYTDVPVKTTIKLSRVLPDCYMFKAIPVTYFYGAPGQTKEFEFRDINVTWE